MYGPIKHLIRPLMTLALASGVAGEVMAGVITLDATSAGSYDQAGNHLAADTNYIAGRSVVERRDFFVFDLSGITAPILSAELSLFNPSTAQAPQNGFQSTQPTETFTAFEVSTPISTLIATNSGQTAIFNDLGSGTVYGTRTVSGADNGQLVTVDLDAAAIAALNVAGAAHAAFAFGGAITTLIPNGGNEFVFGFTNASFPRQLVLDVVPEPTSLMLFGLGLLGMACYGWRPRGPATIRSVRSITNYRPRQEAADVG